MAQRKLLYLTQPEIMNLDALRSSAQRLFRNLDARLARTPDHDSTAPEEKTPAAIGRLKELLSADLDQGQYREIVEGVPLYGWLALDAARASDLGQGAVDTRKLLNAGSALELHQGWRPENGRNLGLIQSATERAIEKEPQLMNWSLENGVDLIEEVSGLCEKLKDVEVLLEPGFIECVHKREEIFFAAFNTHEKLRMHSDDVNTALARVEGLMQILRSRWNNNKLLILRLLPLSGHIRIQNLEQRVGALVKCRMVLTHLLQVWTADNLHSQKARMLFSSQEYDGALAEEEKISVRRWQDIETSHVRNWVARNAKEFAATHLIDGYSTLNEKFTSDPQFRHEFQSLPRVVFDKVREDAKGEKLGDSHEQIFTAAARGGIMVMGVIGLIAMTRVYSSWNERCPFCGRDHRSTFHISSIAKFPAAMVPVLGGTLHPGREMRHQKGFAGLLVPASAADPAPDPQTLGTFEIGKYEVTYGEWKRVRAYGVDNGYSDLPKAEEGTGSSYPVTGVTWYDVVKWCNAKSEMEGRIAVYEVDGATFKSGEYGRTGSQIVTQRVGANGYRLPTGAEWEWAACGRQSPAHSRSLYSGSHDANAVAWYNNNTSNRQFVGNKKANELGLHDMSGNVWEWCWDPKSNDSPERQIRGGSYRSHDTLSLQIPQRLFRNPDGSFDDVGFRLVRGPAH